MIFYRYDDINFEGGPQLFLSEYILVKETPCGYWIRRHESMFSFIQHKTRWVSKTARKRRAYPTKQEALNSFIARKKRQLIILRWQKERAEEALLLAKEINLET